ncbi:hypothetical protein ABGB17_14490 [Sphaerisporangium sp. B11E5]|uniref:hypothetical protein n=1 Tax=Sphaerisporangium sp. B11E5 TaxID=3153563 RepID=UPI00325F33C7
MSVGESNSGPLRISRSWFDAGTQGLGCGLVVVIVLLCAVGGGFVDNFLIARTMIYCGLGGSSSGALDLNQRFDLVWFQTTRFFLFPVVSVLSGMVSLLLNPLALWSPLGRWWITRLLLVIAAIFVTMMGPALLIIHDFATVATPAYYEIRGKGPSGLCDAENVPLWWPSWLPS